MERCSSGNLVENWEWDITFYGRDAVFEEITIRQSITSKFLKLYKLREIVTIQKTHNFDGGQPSSVLISLAI